MAVRAYFECKAEKEKIKGTFLKKNKNASWAAARIGCFFFTFFSLIEFVFVRDSASVFFSTQPNNIVIIILIL